MIPAPVFAAAVVLIAAAAGSGDYELVTTPPADQPICAKSLATCREAMTTVRDFGLFIDLRIREMSCRPHPGCFPEASNFIRGFNSPGDRR